MLYRSLGKTGLTVSALGFGASPLGGVFGEVDESEGIRAVHTALDHGVNFFDVAPYYGLTRAETVLGRALKSVSRERFLLATKVGRYGATDFDFSAQRAAASVEESLRRLNVETIDLIQCHDVEFGSLDQVVEETIPALERLREQGKARFIGISGLPLPIFPAVLHRAPVDAVLSYCHYTLFDTTLPDLLPTLRAHRVGVINASPLAMGLLSGRSVPDWHPASPAIREACRKAAEYCRRAGADIAQLALRFALAAEEIDTTLVGMADRQTVERNVACVGVPPDSTLSAEVQNILEPIRNHTWPSGRPENSEPRL